ncbi:hypothetical protein LY78DRAFT_471622 [Colletotrichum sublineola]|nr:hypothetical protein LY78DRAFT_471622 [Colletotrichum sublineola]
MIIRVYLGNIAEGTCTTHTTWCVRPRLATYYQPLSPSPALRCPDDPSPFAVVIPHVKQLYSHQPHQPLPCRRPRTSLSPLSPTVIPPPPTPYSKSPIQKRSHEDLPKTTIACPPRSKLVVNRQSSLILTPSPAVKRRSSRRAPHYQLLNRQR